MLDKSRVVYTAILNYYDELKDIRTWSSDWDYICFTNHQELLDNPPSRWETVETKLTGSYGSRDLKINPHKHLPQYKEWLWLDGSIVNTRHLNFKHVEEDLLLFRHNTLDPQDEFMRAINGNRGDVNIMRDQLKTYDEQNIPRKKGMFMGGLIYRKNTAAVKKFNNAWWKEYKKFPSRDQMSLYKIIHTKLKGLNWGVMDPYMDLSDFMIAVHKEQPDADKTRNEFGNIYEFTPSGIGKNFDHYGDVLNLHCSRVPFDEDWIIIRDQDTMYFPTPSRRKIIREATMQYPDTGVFGAYTNRTGLDWQRFGGIDDNSNIMDHYHKAVELEEKHESQCKEIDLPVAGFFMMFRKGTWKNIRFKEGAIGETEILFDWDFCTRVKENLKMPVRLIKGLYIFHFYRMHKNVSDTTHIFKIK